MLSRFDPAMIEKLNVIFNVIGQLNGQSLRRVERYLKVVRAIPIVRTNSQRGLLLDCCSQRVFG
jgi:hypothetical protein